MLGGRRRSGRKDIKSDEEKRDEKDKERRKEIVRIAGWKNKHEVDMEDGRGRNKRRDLTAGIFWFV